MGTPKNVQIPYELFISLLDVLEYIDVSEYAEDFKSLFENVLAALKYKKVRIALRDDYSRLVNANKTDDDDAKFSTRIEYLKNRNALITHGE